MSTVSSPVDIEIVNTKSEMVIGLAGVNICSDTDADWSCCMETWKLAGNLRIFRLKFE